MDSWMCEVTGNQDIETDSGKETHAQVFQCSYKGDERFSDDDNWPKSIGKPGVRSNPL